MNYAKELIRDKRCPIFKRRMFFQPYEYEIFNTLGQPGKELYDYLKSTGLYDVNLIWDNILRTCHQADFVKNLHLNYILSSSSYDQNKMDEILKDNLSLESYQLTQGLLFGNKAALDDDFYALSQKMGIAHVFAVSGLHVGLVISFVLLLFPTISRDLNLPMEFPAQPAEPHI